MGGKTWDVHSAVHRPLGVFTHAISGPERLNDFEEVTQLIHGRTRVATTSPNFFIQGPSSFLRLSKFSGSSILALLCIILQTFKLIIVRIRIYWEGIFLKISNTLILKYPSHQGLVNHMEWPTLSAQLNHCTLIRQWSHSRFSYLQSTSPENACSIFKNLPH